MTDIDDKALDELVNALGNQKYARSTFPICARSAMLKAADAITTLRARVKELEADVKTQMEVARRMDGFLYAAHQHERGRREFFAAKALWWKVNARQVTREHALEAVFQAARAYSVDAPLFAKTIPDGFCLAVAENLGLEIVEDKPEGRECKCNWNKVVNQYRCRALSDLGDEAPYKATRCTITEGERDETL